MVNERQAVRWGIPSQFLQWVWGVAGFLWRLPPFRWQRWFAQWERPEQGIATSRVGRGQAPVERGVVLWQRELVLGLEAAVRHVPGIIGVQPIVIQPIVIQPIVIEPTCVEPTCVEPTLREQFWLVERRGVAWGEHRART